MRDNLSSEVVGFDRLNRIIGYKIASCSYIVRPIVEMQQMTGLQATLGSHHERLLAMQRKMIGKMDACHERIMACLGRTEATDLVANPEEKESVPEHRVVPKEQAAVKPVGGLRKRHRFRDLRAERRQKPKERTRGNCGSQKKLAASGMKVTRRTGVTRRKGHEH
jgi:hypothetical protein